MADERGQNLGGRKGGRRFLSRRRQVEVIYEVEEIEMEGGGYQPGERLDQWKHDALADAEKSGEDLEHTIKDAASKQRKSAPLRWDIVILACASLALIFTLLLSFKGFDVLLAGAATKEGSAGVARSMVKYLAALAPFIEIVLGGTIAALILKIRSKRH